MKDLTIYSVYVRNHTSEGTFKALIKDLARIKDLGVDVIWLMPIHPIGERNKKGSLGCPYSILDYDKVNPEYGTLEDFVDLVQAIHENEMKLMIDVVYNHTAYDSKLMMEHPEYFYKNEKGDFANRFGEWTDVADLDFDNEGLWPLLIDSLKGWTKLGVDGFRCDVATVVPLDFWRRAKAEVHEIKGDMIWLAESVHPSFRKLMVDKGHYAASDQELHQVFDLTYDYDVHYEYDQYLKGEIDLEAYASVLNTQYEAYDLEDNKLRFLENHDQMRAMALFSTEDQLMNWTAFKYFEKGSMLLYAGQEALNAHCPSLFEVDKVQWATLNDAYESVLSRLSALKKAVNLDGESYCLKAIHDDVLAIENNDYLGYFNLKNYEGIVDVDLPTGEYVNLFDNSHLLIKMGKVHSKELPLIIKVK